ncbi:cytochrome P450 [Mycobacterium gordonae]|uniref:Cytochrome n=1 Tax=Mycobacterium gordonae TaxID=1778 RepID=A0A1A6B6G7_MYCGO|nr:cytochrome P450 [Mycobacterium gordonae]MCV7006134.1 cytochrome P450 [Mycobacterium gordonae]OBR97934.1 cytochrome [Mycobacterium gordonae]ODR19689.1 cytochrome [Mycobacterium gordonae]ORV74029.1 cytochrome [Mycobacterium gordonae]
MTATIDPVDFFGDAAIQDPYPLYARLRTDGGVHRVGDSDFYLVSSWAAITEVVNRPDIYSSNLTATMTFSPDKGVAAFPMEGVGGRTHILVTADDPVHAAHRKLMLGQFTAKRVQAFQPLIVEVFEKLWATAALDGGIEWMDGLANRLPMTIVADLIGVPEADADQLARWGYASTQLLDGLMAGDELAASMAAIGELSAYITTRLQQAAANPGDDLIGALAKAQAAGELDNFTAQLILVSLFSAGGESTASLLGTAVDILATDGELQRKLRDEPELLGVFIEETLRLEPPFRAHYRHVLKDTELAGSPLPKDSKVLLLWGAVNRDPEHFEAPNEFRLDRRNSKAHMSFGKGIHFCLGAPLARLEATTVLRMLLDRTEWFDAAEVGPWLPSVLARRREFLRLTFK